MQAHAAMLDELQELTICASLLIPHAVHVETLGIPTKAHTAVTELIDVNLSGAVHIQQLEESVCVTRTEFQCFEVLLQLQALIRHVSLHLLQADRTRVISINTPEDLFHVLHIRPLLQHHFLDTEISILLRRLHGTLNKNSCDNVREAKDAQGEESKEAGAQRWIHPEEELRKLSPVSPSCDGHVKTDHGLANAAKGSLKILLLTGRRHKVSTRLKVGSHHLHKEHAETENHEGHQ
mmetsp:Transcript_1068/g.2452  ORF Transcript_1068/g.2452 Transcript_1068/m.2452 type:complete len:236 (-) Transcript_1068:1498-2205(-)